MIKLERNLWISDKADQLDQAFLSGDMHSMYTELGAITRFAKAKSSSIQRVNNADGIPTQSSRAEKIAIGEHFGKTMCAQTQSFASVIRKDREESNNGDLHNRIMHVTCEHMCDQTPSPSEVINLHGMSKRGKAPGEDLCSGNVLCMFSVDL